MRIEHTYVNNELKVDRDIIFRHLLCNALGAARNTHNKCIMCLCIMNRAHNMLNGIDILMCR